MDIVKQAELLKNKKKSNYVPGSVYNIFDYNDKCARNECDELPNIIKPDPIESKKKKSLN